MKRAPLRSVGMLCLLGTQVTVHGGQLYFNDFDGTESSAPGVAVFRSGVQATEPVQGYAGLGAGADSFGGSFIRNTTSGGTAGASTFTIQNIPPHGTVSISFLFAAIDSWDGTAFPPAPAQAPDYFIVRANGTVIFQQTFTNLTNLGSVQSYDGPALAREQQLGFEQGPNRADSAYLIVVGMLDMSHDLTIDFYAGGSGWMGGGSATDESWGLDNIRVSVPAQGDFNSDGSVDQTDLSILNDGFNQHLTDYRHGDFDGSGVIDSDDYAQFDRALARQTTPSATSLVVPDPVSGWILLVAAAGLRRRAVAR
jgi:hypothetical protein